MEAGRPVRACGPKPKPQETTALIILEDGEDPAKGTEQQGGGCTVWEGREQGGRSALHGGE